MLLDEPTSGLDPVVGAELLDVLFEFMRDGERAIFYSNHILSDISRLADELAFLDNGRIKLRRAKEDLTDHWRRISFRSRGNNLQLTGVASHKHEGAEHLVISSDHDLTLRQLSELGAEQVEEQRMGIDEIAVRLASSRSGFTGACSELVDVASLNFREWACLDIPAAQTQNP